MEEPLTHQHQRVSVQNKVEEERTPAQVEQRKRSQAGEKKRPQVQLALAAWSSRLGVMPAGLPQQMPSFLNRWGFPAVLAAMDSVKRITSVRVEPRERLTLFARVLRGAIKP